MFTRQEMIGRIARETGLERRAVALVISRFIDEIESSLVDGRPVQLRPLGTLKPVSRKARIGRVLETNEPLGIPGRKSVVFRPAERLRRKLNP